MTAGRDAVRGEGLCRRHRRGAETVEALVAVDIRAAPGELVVVHGPSGSGKTTLCHLLAGLDEPDEGRVLRPSGTPTPPTWHDVAIVPQRLALVAALTIGEQSWLAQRSDPGPGPGLDIEALHERLDLMPVLERRPEELSHGERQRAAIARALAGAPVLVVLDEPTSSQDEHHLDLVVRELTLAAEWGAAVVIASHDVRIRAVASRLVELVDGRTVPPGH